MIDLQRKHAIGPIFDSHYGWTVPKGYKHPSCPSCGRADTKMRPMQSVGGASVTGVFCRKCTDELNLTGA